MLASPATDTQITHRRRLWLYVLVGLIVLFLIAPSLLVVPLRNRKGIARDVGRRAEGIQERDASDSAQSEPLTGRAADDDANSPAIIAAAGVDQVGDAGVFGRDVDVERREVFHDALPHPLDLGEFGHREVVRVTVE